MQLEVAGQRARIAARLAKTRLLQTGAGQPSKERIPAPARRGERLGVEYPCHGEAAQQPDERPLLVGEVDRLQRHRQIEAVLLYGAEDLQRGDHAQRPVETAAVRH